MEKLSSFVIIGANTDEFAHFYYFENDIDKADKIFEGRKSSYNWMLFIDINNGIVVKRKVGTWRT